MDAEYYAHTPATPGGEWHKLEDHLREVARMAEEFGEAFGAGEVCKALGFAHDLGKRDARFQAYLQACARGERHTSVPHAAAGAAVAADCLGPFALAVLGHHAGLPDKSDARSRLENADPPTIEAARAGAAGLARPAVPEWVSGPRNAEFLIRMCFSALTDADYLDTERHLSPDLAAERGRAHPPEWYARSLDGYLANLRSKAERTEVNRFRDEILGACQCAAGVPPQAFRLTVPTGGGKTLASLAFALRHALANDLRRVIVAIPYTSIIDQTVAVYASVFGEDHVLAHHSGYDPSDATEDQSVHELRRKLATENWDIPLIVTTTVQLFESLFSNRPRSCRKLHRIARSVIILDEAQTPPPELLSPILDVLDELIKHYGCSVVFCTATQPDYSALNGTVLAAADEIVPNPSRYFERLRRVTYTRAPRELTVAEVAVRVDAAARCLCIVNTRRDAVRIARACRRDDALFHLSTLMVPDHRRRVLDEVRRRLADGLPVRLVSTQVVEAGVDLDFPFVMRVLSPLDRIVQAAGRCNREGRMPCTGECLIFELEDAGAPSGWYRTGIGLAGTMVSEDAATLDRPDRVAEYFRDLFRHTSTDARDIQGFRDALAFATVAERFQLIPNEAVEVVVRTYADSAADRMLAVPVEARGARWYRDIARFSVGLPSYEVQRLERGGTITTEKGGLRVYEGIYDTLIGIGSGDEPDPADLVV